MKIAQWRRIPVENVVDDGALFNEDLSKGDGVFVHMLYPDRWMTVGDVIEEAEQYNDVVSSCEEEDFPTDYKTVVASLVLCVEMEIAEMRITEAVIPC